eukprot:jgi/Botrbrau1/22171/Bobra.168_1s0003.1
MLAHIWPDLDALQPNPQGEDDEASKSPKNLLFLLAEEEERRIVEAAGHTLSDRENPNGCCNGKEDERAAIRTRIHALALAAEKRCKQTPTAGPARQIVCCRKAVTSTFPSSIQTHAVFACDFQRCSKERPNY